MSKLHLRRSMQTQVFLAILHHKPVQVYVACGYELTAAVAFPSLAYFQLLRFPLVMLPSTIENCVNGLIALRRLQAFLEASVATSL